MAYGIVYKITNILNGKVYIGQTTRGLKKRWKAHCDTARYYAKYRAGRKRRDTHFYKAVRKYGPEKFTCEVLAEASNQQELNNLEAQYIVSHDSLLNGYNCTAGGEHPEWRPESKRKLSESLQLSHSTKISDKVIKLLLKRIKAAEILWILDKKEYTRRPEKLKELKETISECAHKLKGKGFYLNWTDEDDEVCHVPEDDETLPRPEEEHWDGRGSDPSWEEVRNKERHWSWNGSEFVDDQTKETLKPLRIKKIHKSCKLS